MLGGRVQSAMQNAKAVVVPSKEIGLEVKAVGTKYMVMYRE
jgi:hypothetical protein